MKIDWNKLNPLPMFKDTSLSLFSDGKVSAKRVSSFIALGGVLYIVRAVVHHNIPADSHNLVMHVYDGLLMLIGTLLIGATWQDVAKNKVQGKTDQTKAENPITPPDQAQ